MTKTQLVLTTWLARCLLAMPNAACAQSAAPPKFTLGQFRALQWIAGSWRGADGAGKPFYEEYRVVDDSTIAMRQYTDSTFRAVTPDSSRIEWRGGVVSSRGSGVPYIAESLTATSVTFVRPGTTRRFTFERDSADQWTARIRPPNAAEVVYVMTRVRGR